MNLSIIEKRKIWFSISLIIIILGIIMMPVNAFRGIGALNFDVEFIGGTLIEVNIGQDFNAREDIKPIVVDIIGDENPQVTKLGDNAVRIKTKVNMTTDQRTKLYDTLKDKYNLDQDGKYKGDLLTEANVTPTISTEMQIKALQAIALAAVLMLIYITFRFKDWRFGISAVIALVHDILVVLAVYSIVRVAVNNSFVAVMLTIVGYSINDTIVLFDRIRENKKVAKRGDLVGLVDRSINQTIIRSINTSLTTLITITVLYFLGVPSIKEFALPLMVGILAGTYSSIFIASPLWYLFRKKDTVKTSKQKI